jgi:hypothetical protein
MYKKIENNNSFVFFQKYFKTCNKIVMEGTPKYPAYIIGKLLSYTDTKFTVFIENEVTDFNSFPSIEHLLKFKYNSKQPLKEKINLFFDDVYLRNIITPKLLENTIDTCTYTWANPEEIGKYLSFH